MANLIRRDDSLTLPIQYFGSVEYYALMSAYRNVVIDDCIAFDKRFKSVHRTAIADTRGVLSLTVPIVKASAGRRPLSWRDIAISDHGQWWHVVATSLASAYGRTPFFEYYIDRFKPFFSQTTVTSFRSIAELDVALNRLIVDILGLESNITYASELADATTPRCNLSAVEAISPEPYYQIRADKYGFIPNLSILDLIFNLGPESPLHLARLTSKL